MTQALFREDAYRAETEAIVLASEPRGIALDRTVFYPQGGGQNGDQGALMLEDGTAIPIANTTYDSDRTTILHAPAEGAALPRPGARVIARIDWGLRLKRMRAHTALHLLSVILPYPVTGGSVGDAEGRLDFDSGEAVLDKAEVERRLNELIALDRAVTHRWIADAELEANPGLIKTMAVKPPMGTGRVRLIAIEGLDLQPCGGTHVARTGEIGRASVTGIEKKGKINRRVRIALGASVDGMESHDLGQLLHHRRARGRARRPRPRPDRRVLAPAQFRTDRRGRIPGEAHSGRRVLRH